MSYPLHNSRTLIRVNLMNKAQMQLNQHRKPNARNFKAQKTLLTSEL